VTVERGHAFTHPEHDFMRAQVDGFIPDWNAHLEIKTAGLLNPRYDYSDWGDANTDQIPFQYLVQCQFALMCSGKEVVHLLAQLGCGRVTPYRIERHDELNTQILERCLAFWDAVQGNYAPSDETPSLDTLTRITRQSGESVTVDEQFPDEWEALKAQEAAIKAAIDHKKAEILHAMGEAQIGTTTVGNFYATDNSGRPRFRFKGI
jgi:predicted phage-related endonuclease